MKLTNTFTKGIMNKDLDERLVPNGQYRDGQNIGVSTSEESSVGSIENILGNTEVGSGYTFTVNAVTIGAYADDARETIYWLVADTDFDYVMKYNSNTNISTVLLKDTKNRVLKFNSEFIVTGISLIGDLLFWTDNLNAPRKLNIKKYYPLDGFIEDDISVIVKPPLNGPVIELSDTGTTNEENFIKDKFFRFAYRWKYENNEYSSLSPFSSTAFSPTSYNYNYSDGEFVSMLNEFNQVDITIGTGDERVTDVQLVVTNELTSQVFIVQTFNKQESNWANNTTKVVYFNNSKLYSLLAADEVTRLFDNVPLKAQAQDIIGSRLMYGNYIIGRNLVNEDGQKIPIDFSVELNDSTGATEINPKPTFRSDRDYEIAISYLDAEGRMTTPLIPTQATSITTSNTIYIPPTASVTANDLRVVINNRPPAFADKYRIFIKQNEYDFDLIFPNFYYLIDDQAYFRIERADVNKVKDGDYIICKRTDGIATLSNREFKVVNVEVKEKNFLGNNEISGLYMQISDPSGFFQITGTFSESYDTRGLWNNYSESYAFGGNEIADADPIRNQISVVEFPIFYGASTTNNELTISSNVPTTLGLDSKRIKVLVQPNNEYRLYYMSSLGGYVSYSSITPMSFNPGAPNNIPDPANPNNTICRVTFSNGPGYLVNDYFIINLHSSKKPGDGFAVINSGMDVNEWQNAGGPYAQSATGGGTSALKTYSRCAIVPGSIDDNWRLDTPLTSPNFRDRPIEAGAVIEIQITEDIYTQGTLSNGNSLGQGNMVNLQGVQDPFAFLQATPPSTTMTFVASKKYKNIEEWWYEDRVFLDWDGHPDIFNGAIQRSGKCRVAFTRGNWSTATNPLVGSFNQAFNLSLQNTGWTNQMFQKNGGTLANPPLGYPSWATYIAAELPMRMIVVSSFNADADTQDNLLNNPDLVNIRVVFNINQASRGRPVFETKSTSQDIDIFYETKTLDIDKVNNRHLSNILGQDQSIAIGGSPAVISLNTTSLTTGAAKNNEENAEYNAYTFGNGVEAMTIRGDWNGTKLKYSPRVSTPIDDYGQERLQASLTYSGVFRENTTVNNLNEFNLSLANFKDLQLEYGPLRKIHARDTDVVVFQEDKVSKVLYGKNLLSDSAGGGNVTSIPEVLGTQITYAGEYGISENPESFAYWGNDMYFADAKRGAVCKLGVNGIFEISQQGMSDYFKDLFRDNFRTQKLGAIDPFKEQYVISDTDTAAPPCDFSFYVNIPSTDGGVGNKADDWTIEVTSTASWTLELIDAGYGIGWASLNGSNPVTSGFGDAVVTLSIGANIGITYRDIIIRGTGCAGVLPDISVRQSSGTLVTRDVIGGGLNADGVADLEADFEYDSLSTGLVPFNNTKITPDSKTTFAFDQIRAIETKNGIPETGANLTMRATQTGALGRKSFELTLGNKMYYCLTNNQYNQTQLDQIIADPGTVTLAPTLAAGVYSDTFLFNNAANNEYFYLVYDFRSKFVSGDTLTCPAAVNNHSGTLNADVNLGANKGRVRFDYTATSGGGAVGNRFRVYKGDDLIVESGATPVIGAGSLNFIKKQTDGEYRIEIDYFGDNKVFDMIYNAPTLTAFDYETTAESLDPTAADYVCRALAPLPTDTRYHDGAALLPDVGDTTYEDPNGLVLNPINNAPHRMGTSLPPNMNWIFGGNDGVVLDVGPCAPCAEVAGPVYNGPANIGYQYGEAVNIQLDISGNAFQVETASTVAVYVASGGEKGGTIQGQDPNTTLLFTMNVNILETVEIISALPLFGATGTVTSALSTVTPQAPSLLPPGLILDTQNGLIQGKVDSYQGVSQNVAFRATNCFGATLFNVSFDPLNRQYKTVELDISQAANVGADACAFTSSVSNVYFNGAGNFPVVGDRVFKYASVPETAGPYKGLGPFNGGYSYWLCPGIGANGAALLIDDNGMVIERFVCP